MAALARAVRGRGPTDCDQIECRSVVPTMAARDARRQYARRGRYKAQRTGLRQARIGPSPHARARDRDGVTARLITYRLGKERQEYRLLCSIMDPRKAPAIQLANLYARRWTIETVLGELKTRLRGARVVLRSRIPDLTRQDFYGLLLAHFGVRALMHDAALQQKIDATDLSFIHAVRTIARYLPLYVSFFPSAEEEAPQITLA